MAILDQEQPRSFQEKVVSKRAKRIAVLAIVGAACGLMLHEFSGVPAAWALAGILAGVTGTVGWYDAREDEETVHI